jgi:hypothetical protein
MKMVKYEAVHSERLSTLIEADARLAKKAFEHLCLPPIEKNKNSIIGFIQEISLDPYGILMLSDIQVLIFC